MNAHIPTRWIEPLRHYELHLYAAGMPRTTVSTRLYHLRNIARRLGKDAGPWEITGNALVQWAGAQNWATETRRGYRNSCKSFWCWGIAAKCTDSNPVDSWPPVAAAKPRPRPAPNRIYRAALNAADPRTRVMLRLAAECGLRRTEVAKVHTRDLCEEIDGWVLIVHGKGDKDRRLPIPDDIAALVRAGARGHTPDDPFAPREGYLFPGADDGHLSPRYVGTLCSRALEAVQGDGNRWTMHKLRHRFATLSYRATRDIRAVQEALGHTSVATTQIYTAVDRNEVRTAVNAAA